MKNLIKAFRKEWDRELSKSDVDDFNWAKFLTFWVVLIFVVFGGIAIIKGC